MSVQTLTVQLTDGQLKALKDACDEINVSMNKIDGEKEQIKDIVDAAYDMLKVPKKTIMKLAKAQYKQSVLSETAEFNEFVALFEAMNEVK